jgi:hypothetical protein
VLRGYTGLCVKGAKQGPFCFPGLSRGGPSTDQATRQASEAAFHVPDSHAGGRSPPLFERVLQLCIYFKQVWPFRNEEVLCEISKGVGKENKFSLIRSLIWTCGAGAW